MTYDIDTIHFLKKFNKFFLTLLFNLQFTFLSTNNLIVIMYCI
jgi:hypothetical protein